MSNATDAAFMAAQCAEGHEGKLCGKCAKRFGQRMNALFGRCQQCASTTRILLLYFLAAVASMTFIRIMCFFNGQHGRLATVGSSVSQAQQPAAASASTPSALSGTKEPLEHIEAADSDAAMARGMPGPKDQLSIKDAATRPCKMCGRTSTAGSAQNGAAGPNKSARAPAGDLLKPFTIYLQASCLHLRCQAGQVLTADSMACRTGTTQAACLFGKPGAQAQHRPYAHWQDYTRMKKLQM